MSGLPKTIWRYWDQGWDKAPFTVQKCTESVKKYAGDWEIIDLDRDSLGEYLRLPDIFQIEEYPIQVQADYIRCELLQRYGGVWADATLFFNRDFTEFMSQIDSDFFCFFRHKYSAMSNWFLVSKPDTYIINTFFDSFKREIFSKGFLDKNKKLFKSWRGSPDYDIFHRIFERLIRRDSEFNKEVQEIPFLETFPQMAPALFGLRNIPSNELVCLVNGNVPVIKLAHHYKEEECNEESLLKTIINSLEGKDTVSYKHNHLSINNKSISVWRSYANNPYYVKDWSGSFVSVEDLRVIDKKYPRYHVYNFSPHDGRNTSQLLMPVGDDRLFLRHQEGNNFSIAREVAYADEIRQLHDRIRVLEERLAVESYIRKAEAGDSQAQYQLGNAYLRGEGVSKDFSESVKWFHKAAEKGNQHAQYRIGAAYQRGEGVLKDEVEALKWFRKSAEQGNQPALYQMGDAYLKGWGGVKQDKAEAEKWFRKAADQGFAPAKNILEKSF